MSDDASLEYLYHYYERCRGPFRNLSDLQIGEAQEILDGIKADNRLMAAHRYPGYLERRSELEELARSMFVSKGGRPVRQVPHYMVVGHCPWLLTWYLEPEHVRVPLADFSAETISFTYGDLFPTFSSRVTDQREYRRQVYTLPEILELVQRYGLPQNWNDNGQHGPERYIEAQVWDDLPIAACLDTGDRSG